MNTRDHGKKCYPVKKMADGGLTGADFQRMDKGNDERSQGAEAPAAASAPAATPGSKQTVAIPQMGESKGFLSGLASGMSAGSAIKQNKKALGMANGGAVGSKYSKRG